MTLSILSVELTEAVIHENLLHSGSSSSIWIRIKYRYSSLQCALPQWQGSSHAIEITQCYLPPGRGDIPAFTPAEAGTRFSDPGGMQGSGDLGTAVKMCSPRLHIAALKTKKNFCTSDHKKTMAEGDELQYSLYRSSWSLLFQRGLKAWSGVWPGAHVLWFFLDPHQPRVGILQHLRFDEVVRERWDLQHTHTHAQQWDGQLSQQPTPLADSTIMLAPLTAPTVTQILCFPP